MLVVRLYSGYFSMNLLNWEFVIDALNHKNSFLPLRVYNKIMNETHLLAERLHQVKQFNDIPIEYVEKIIADGDIKEYRKGEYIFHERNDCAGLFVLITGQVNLVNLVRMVEKVSLIHLSPSSCSMKSPPLTEV